MPNIFASNDRLATLPPIVGIEILDLVKSTPGQRATLFDIFHGLKKKDWFSSKSIYYALIFLFVTGLIDFDGAYFSGVDNVLD